MWIPWDHSSHAGTIRFPVPVMCGPTVFVEHPSLTVPVYTASFLLPRNPPRHPYFYLARREPQDPRDSDFFKVTETMVWNTVFSLPFSDTWVSEP